MNKKFKIALFTLGGLIVIYLLSDFFLSKTTPLHEEAHTHTSFIPFPKDLLEKENIPLEQVAPVILTEKVRAPASIIIADDKIAQIFPKVTGTVLQVYKNIGEKISENEVLALIDSKELAEAKGSCLAATNKQLLTKSILTREKCLHDKKLTSTEDYQQAESNHTSALLDLDLSKQKLQGFGLSEKDVENKETPSNIYSLTSPINGTVVEKDIHKGEKISSEKLLFIIADLSLLWGKIHIFPQDRKYVSQGQEVILTDDHGNKAHTFVQFLSPTLNQDTATSLAIVTIDNTRNTWIPGTFAQAEFITKTTPVNMAVTNEAIQNIDGIDIVFIYEDEGFYTREIVKGRSSEAFTEILSGIETNEKYASKNTFLLKADLKKDEAEHMD